MAKKATESTAIEIQPVSVGTIKLRIIGTTPLFQNRMSAKVKQGLLVGGRKKTAAERVAIKHHPLEEYRNSAEIVKSGPTALGLRVVAIKKAMCDAAIETAGMKKAGAQRLLFMPGDHAPLYGTPKLRMDVTRSADIARTPDIRTRAFLPKWGAEVEIRYVKPQMSQHAVVTLLVNAGMLIGVGDFRQQKGAGAYGAFRVIGEGQPDDEWDDLVANHGRDAQLKALESPEYADEETAELMEFWNSERIRRAG